MTDNAPQKRPRLTPEGVTTLLDIVGMLLVSGGVAAIYWPAALIIAGAGVLLTSWKATR